MTRIKREHAGCYHTFIKVHGTHEEHSHFINGYFKIFFLKTFSDLAAFISFGRLFHNAHTTEWRGFATPFCAVEVG